MIQDLMAVKKNLENSLGLLEELNIQGQKNIMVLFNIFAMLNGAMSHFEGIEKELKDLEETEQLNKEKIE